MPEENAEQCIGEEARQVAEYVYREYYSRANKESQPRLKVMRLTVPQYRNALADLFAPFSPSEPGADPESSRRPGKQPASPRMSDAATAHEPGLHGQYFQSKGMSKADSLALERNDGLFAFEFGDKSPAEGIDAEQFSIIWEGGLNARHTGYYEFRLSTKNALAGCSRGASFVIARA